MDVSTLTAEDAANLGQLYAALAEENGTSPLAASARTQRRLRRRAEKWYLCREALSPEATAALDKAVSDEAFFAFLAACGARWQQEEAQRLEAFEQVFAGRSASAAQAIKMLMESHIGCPVRRVGAEWQIELDARSAYSHFLTLENATGLSEGTLVSFENGTVERSADGYRLSGEEMHMSYDDLRPITITFTDAWESFTVFRADRRCFEDCPLGSGGPIRLSGEPAGPWEQLVRLAGAIVEKHRVLPASLNEAEQAVLPIATALAGLNTFWFLEFDAEALRPLEAYAAANGYDELRLPLERVKAEQNYRRRRRAIRRLLGRLNTQRYESLWRQLYGQLAATQTAYPARAEVCCPSEKLRRTRDEITRLLAARGYTGTYPDFVKADALRGVRVAESWGQNYFIAAEKHMTHYIHCNEGWCDDRLVVEFWCGTALLRPGEGADIYSCLFRANGRRFFRLVRYEDPEGTDSVWENHDLPYMVTIAAKRAELERLTGAERRAVGAVRLHWLLGLVTGVVFAGELLLVMVLIAAMVGLVGGQPRLVGEMLATFPWQPLVIGGGLLYGLLKGIIDALAR